jgi:hypothetical protein
VAEKKTNMIILCELGLVWFGLHGLSCLLARLSAVWAGATWPSGPHLLPTISARASWMLSVLSDRPAGLSASRWLSAMVGAVVAMVGAVVAMVGAVVAMVGAVVAMTAQWSDVLLTQLWPGVWLPNL